MDGEAIVTRARVRLLQDPKLAFFAHLALQLVPTPSSSVPTMGTDGRRLLFNPQWVARRWGEAAATGTRDVADRQMMAVVVHEVLHCALMHLFRKGDRVKAIWNAACDYAANQIIIDAGLRLPAGALLSEEFRGLSAEEIYCRLNTAYSPSPSQPWGDHSPWGTAEDGSPISPAAAEALAQKWRVAVVQAAQAAEAAGQGDLPAGVRRLVQAALQPKVEWRRVLWAFVQPSRVDYAWAPPDRRLLWQGVILPDLAEESVEDLVVAIDTSGSIDEAVLGQFLAEVNAILQTFPVLRGHLLACDAEVHVHLELDGAVDAVPQEFFRGGGGTDFRPVFKWVAENMPNPPACLVYLTDGYGYVQDDPPAYPVLWVLHGTRTKRPEWGQVVEVESA